MGLQDLLKPKGAGHDAYTDCVRRDWAAMIIGHPERFDALLYKAVRVSGVPEDSEAKFESIDENVSDISYADPVVVSAVESTGEDDDFIPSLDGDESMGFGESGLMLLRISDFDVPEGSSIEFLVSLAGGELQGQSWYVLRSKAIGSPAVGFVHYCIPNGHVGRSNAPDPAPAPAQDPAPAAETPPTEPDGALFSAG